MVFHMGEVCTAIPCFVLDTRDYESWVNGTLPKLAKWVYWPILIPREGLGGTLAMNSELYYKMDATAYRL